MSPELPDNIAQCIVDGKPFVRTNIQQKFCSYECKKKYHNKKHYQDNKNKILNKYNQDSEFDDEIQDHLLHQNKVNLAEFDVFILKHRKKEVELILKEHNLHGVQQINYRFTVYKCLKCDKYISREMLEKVPTRTEAVERYMKIKKSRESEVRKNAT